MAAPVAILARLDDHRGILAMGEAVDAMIERKRLVLYFNPYEFYDETWTED